MSNHKLKNGSVIKTIGDPHLGKKFINGVPLNRRGERETLQQEQFLREMSADGVRTVVMMGDLFDQFRVDNNVLQKTFEIVSEASWKNPETTYFLIQGNHDITRNTESVSSFDILESMCSVLENVKFVKSPEIHITTDCQDYLALFPYDPFISAEDNVESFLLKQTYSAAFGHWDVEDFGSDHNLIPLTKLAPVCDKIFTGHIHTAKVFNVTRDGIPDKAGEVEVILTGSMQPYSFGEDPDANIYVTISLENLEAALLENPDEFKNKAVRLLLKPNEEPPQDLDCLQITYKFVNEDLQEEVQTTSEVFSFKEIFDQCLSENGLDEEIIKEVWEKYLEVSKDDTAS